MKRHHVLLFDMVDMMALQIAPAAWGVAGTTGQLC